MGLAMVWFAVQGKARAEVLAEAAYVDSGAPDDYFEADASVGDLPGGWTVLVCADFDLFNEEVMRDWSGGARLVGCAIDEDEQMSVSLEWLDGQMVWSASFDGADGGDELELSGDLPPAFGAIRDELLREAEAAGEGEAEHIFNAPLKLAESVTGFRHDHVFDGVFTALEPA